SRAPEPARREPRPPGPRTRARTPSDRDHLFALAPAAGIIKNGPGSRRGAREGMVARLPRAVLGGGTAAGPAGGGSWPGWISPGEVMAHQGKPSPEGSESTSTGGTLARPAEQSQLDFELEFFSRILERHPGYVDVLRVQGNNLTLKGRYAEGMQIDKRLVSLRPNDPLAHYNLACSYALLKRPEQAIKTLRRSAELGYRRFRLMRAG